MARRTRAMATALAALAVVVLGSPAFPATRAPDAPDPVAPASTSTKSSAISTLPYPAGSGARTMVSNGQGNHVEATSGPGAIDVSDAGSGFTVIAARGGVVRAARDDSQVGCGDLSCWAEANYVLIDHGDGTSGLYLHLAPSGVVVREGEVVTRGQELAAAGSTGFTTGTHLHFQVQQTPCSTTECRQRPGWWWGRAVEVTFDDADAAVPASSTSDDDSSRPGPDIVTVAPPEPDRDWRNRGYTLTCGDLTTSPVTARVRDGIGRAPGDHRSPTGYEVFVRAVATGDLTGDGRAETAVLLSCGYWGANYSVPAVLVFTAERTLLSQLPTLEPLNGGMGPEIRNRFGVEGGALVTGVGWYAPGDFHVGGPSIHVTLIWRWEGRRFTTTLPFGPPCRPGVDSVTVAGVCIEVPDRWVAVRDVSTWLGADWVDVRPVEECHPAHHCVGFQLSAGTSFDRTLAGNDPVKPFDQDGDGGWWTGTGTPECLTDRLADNPVLDTDLTVSGTRPFGGEQAEYRQWTLACQDGGPQEVRAWILPASRLLVLSGPLPAALQQQVAAVVEGATIS